MSAGIHGVPGNPWLGVAGPPGANLPSIWRTVKGQGPLKWPYIYVVNSGGSLPDDGGNTPYPWVQGGALGERVKVLGLENLTPSLLRQPVICK